MQKGRKATLDISQKKTYGCWDPITSWNIINKITNLGKEHVYDYI